MRFKYAALAVIVFTVIGGLWIALAQDECPSLIDDALKQLDTFCSDLERNNVCYGSRKVEVTFSEEVPADFFMQPGDKTSLTRLQTLRTTPLSVAGGEYGLVLMKLQANLPNTLPGQAITFLIMGDTEIENGVSPEEAVIPSEPITVKTASPVELRSLPNATSELLGTIPAGTQLLADGISRDGVWVRAVYEERPVWLIVISLLSSSELDNLIVLADENRAPMQAFYFRTGIGQAGDCAQAPNSLVIQGPENATVDFSVNGARIRLGRTPPLVSVSSEGEETESTTVADASTVLLQTSESGSEADIITLSGDVTLNPDSEAPIKVPAGNIASLCLSEAQNLGTDGQANDNTIIEGCFAYPPRPLTNTEILTLSVFEKIPITTLEIDIPDQTPVEEIVPPVAPPPIPCVLNNAWTGRYIVQSQDTLLQIAGLFGVTLREMAAGNCIMDGQTIFTGQELRVPPTSGTQNSQNPVLPANPPAAIVGTMGSQQAVLVNQPFFGTIQVRVLDAASAPVPGVDVTFSAPTQGAGGTFQGGVSSVVTVTDFDGLTSAPGFFANGTAGSYQIVATCEGCGTITFDMTNLPIATATFTPTPTATLGTITNTPSFTPTLPISPTLTPSPTPVFVDLQITLDKTLIDGGFTIVYDFTVTNLSGNFISTGFASVDITDPNGTVPWNLPTIGPGGSVNWGGSCYGGDPDENITVTGTIILSPPFIDSNPANNTDSFNFTAPSTLPGILSC